MILNRDSTGTNTKVVGAVTVSSSATAIDTFSSDSYTGSHYVVVGYNSGESGTPASVSEVFVVHDGSTAYVSSGPIVSSKGTDQLTFTAALSGTTSNTYPRLVQVVVQQLLMLLEHI